MAQTKTTKKKTAKKKDTKKSSEKAAKKALSRAKRAVREARSAVAHSSKKLRKRADKLAKESEELSAAHAAATRRADASPSLRAPQTPSPVTVDASHTAISPRNGRTGRTSAHSSPTLVELRARAKEQKITGYYRMNKATLMAAITPPS